MELESEPVRGFFTDRFPRRALRGVQANYRSDVGALLVPGTTANAGTVGTAFNLWLCFRASARPNLASAAAGAWKSSDEVADAFAELALRLDASYESGAAPQPDVKWGPPQIDDEELARICWALALLEELFRAPVAELSPLAALPPGRPVNLLALAPPEGVAELVSLADLACERLLPELRRRSAKGLTWVGPTFAGSAIMNADADVVAGGLLLEVKAKLGDKVADARRAVLSAQIVWQLLGYLLHDFDDRYAITDVGVYQARYGHLALWPAAELLAELVGDEIPITLADARAEWKHFLETGDDMGSASLDVDETPS